MDSYQSVRSFTKTIRTKAPVIDILILNAGIGLLKLERSPTGHDRTTQVNCHSNVLLIADLLPYLRASADKTGVPARITWVGSRSHHFTTFEKKAPIKSDESMIEHMDSEEFFYPYQRYGDSKLLCAMFMCSLAPRLDKTKVILNMVCPGMVNTNMTDVLPAHLRMIMSVVKAIRGRPVEVGGQIILNAALVAGTESHGRFFGDKEMIEKSPYLQSAAGREVQKKLWSETLAEMKMLTRLPPEFTEE